MIRTSTPIKKALKPRKCKSCGTSFVPVRSLQAACSVSCALEIAAKQKAQKLARAQRDERKSIRQALEKAKTRGQHLKELQAVVNAYVRLRDAADGCISCDRPVTWQGQ